jgi:hypothetical protein
MQIQQWGGRDISRQQEQLGDLQLNTSYAGVTELYTTQRSLRAAPLRDSAPKYTSFSLISRHVHIFVRLIYIKASYKQKQTIQYFCLEDKKVKIGSIQILSYYVNYTFRDQFQEVSILLGICVTFQASSADCECGISLRNTLKSKSKKQTDHMENQVVHYFIRPKHRLTCGMQTLGRTQRQVRKASNEAIQNVLCNSNA